MPSGQHSADHYRRSDKQTTGQWGFKLANCLGCRPEPGFKYFGRHGQRRNKRDGKWREIKIEVNNPELISKTRQGYFANISYVDDKIGEILDVLDRTRQEAVIVFVSDHGDMLGERGLWFKMSFREGSARVPLMIAAPGMTPGRIDTPVSTLDVLPTLCDLAGLSLDGIDPWTDGESLLPVCRGEARAPVAMEYAAEGSIAPMVALRQGDWKYTACSADPEQLFDLAADPGEDVNLATDPHHADRHQ